MRARSTTASRHCTLRWSAATCRLCRRLDICVFVCINTQVGSQHGTCTAGVGMESPTRCAWPCASCMHMHMHIHMDIHMHMHMHMHMHVHV